FDVRVKLNIRAAVENQKGYRGSGSKQKSGWDLFSKRLTPSLASLRAGHGTGGVSLSRTSQATNLTTKDDATVTAYVLSEPFVRIKPRQTLLNCGLPSGLPGLPLVKQEQEQDQSKIDQGAI
ncbi:hypothetical protein SFRURICE_017382, partial [Spodoptera frugiperda]